MGEERSARPAEGRIIYLLDTVGRVVGWPPRMMHDERGREHWHVSRFYTPGAREAGDPERDLLLASAGPVEMDGWRVREDGSLFWARVVMSQFQDQAGRMLGFVVVFSARADAEANQVAGVEHVMFPTKLDRRKR